MANETGKFDADRCQRLFDEVAALFEDLDGVPTVGSVALSGDAEEAPLDTAPTTSLDELDTVLSEVLGELATTAPATVRADRNLAAAWLYRSVYLR